MHEILDHLPPDALVLDLGCYLGSFDSAEYPFTTIRTDLSPQSGGPCTNLVQADAARLPFRSRAFNAVICNHGLEHFTELKLTLQEIGRVLRNQGALFVSVPDATTFQDRLYRKLTKGGGHVNLFDSPVELTRKLEWYSGLPHIGARVLHTSFSYLNRRNVRGVIPLRLSAVSWRWEVPLSLLSGVSRFIDRRFGARLSVYGWALYFGNVPERVARTPWSNVCIRCGQAHPSDWLMKIGAVGRKWSFFSSYKCPGCGASNFYSRDSRMEQD